MEYVYSLHMHCLEEQIPTALSRFRQMESVVSARALLKPLVGYNILLITKRISKEALEDLLKEIEAVKSCMKPHVSELK